jgi:hypothetical protein
MALPEPFLIRQKARATDNPDGVSHAKLEAKLMDPERLIIAHALSAAAKPYENDASLLPHNTTSSELTAYKALRGSLFKFSCPLRTALHHGVQDLYGSAPVRILVLRLRERAGATVRPEVVSMPHKPP